MKLRLSADQAYLYRGLMRAQQAQGLPKGWSAEELMRLMIEMGQLWCIFLDGDDRFRGEVLPKMLMDEKIKPVVQFVAMMHRMGKEPK